MFYTILNYFQRLKEYIMRSEISSAALTLVIITLAVNVLAFVIKAIGLFIMARRNGIKHTWLAFIPFANYILIGTLVGQVRVFNFSFKNLGIFVAVFSLCSEIVDIYLDFSVYYEPFMQLINDGVVVAVNEISASYFQVAVSFISSLLSLCYVVTFVFLLIALFRKYEDKHPTLYALLSIFLTPLFGVMLFLIRNKKPIDPMDIYRRNYEKVYGRPPQSPGTDKPKDSPFAEYAEPSDENSDDGVFSEYSSSSNSDGANADKNNDKEERRFGFDGDFDKKHDSTDDDGDDLF